MWMRLLGGGARTATVTATALRASFSLGRCLVTGSATQGRTLYSMVQSMGGTRVGISSTQARSLCSSSDGRPRAQQNNQQ